MKKLLVIMVVVLMMASFAMAADSTEKERTIPVNVNVLPHSVLTVLDGAFDFIFDPQPSVPDGHENQSVLEQTVNINVKSNFEGNLTFHFEYTAESLQDDPYNLVELEFWVNDENKEMPTAPVVVTNTVGNNDYALKIKINNLKQEWYELQATNGSIEIGRFFITLAAF